MKWHVLIRQFINQHWSLRKQISNSVLLLHNAEKSNHDVKQEHYFYYNLMLLYLVSRNITIILIRYGNGTEKETIKLLTFRINRALNRSRSSRPAYWGSPILEHIEFLYLARLRCCKGNKYTNVTVITVIIYTYLQTRFIMWCLLDLASLW